MATYEKWTFTGDIADWDNPEIRQRFLLSAQEIDRKNNEEYRRCCNVRNQMQAMIQDIYKERRRKPSLPEIERPKSQIKEYNKTMRKYQQWQERQWQKAKAADYRKRRQTMQEILASFDFIEGEDYPYGHAVSFAKKTLIHEGDSYRIRPPDPIEEEIENAME